MLNTEGLSGHDPTEQLARLKTLCRRRTVAIYRDEALYLQILRDELRDSTRQALFRLVSTVDPGRLSKLSESNRQRFHGSVDTLISRCAVLLTVEQLMQLMAQMQDEERRRQARMGREMLQSLAQQQQQIPSTPPAGEHDPSGSINLSLHPPISEPQRYAALPQPTAPDPESEPPPEEVFDATTDQGLQGAGDLDVLRSLFQLAGEALEQDAASMESALNPGDGSGALQAGNGFLPDTPEALLNWMEALDQALARRLRNLSHAINVQMLRCGLASTLLPVTLLEAVLRGQVETHSTDSNLLRLRLPVAVGEMEQGVDVLSLLLRSGELEFDSHRLRRCRRRLRQHQQDLRTMVRQQRHWQRRCLDREARSHWQSPSDPNPSPRSVD